MDTIEFRVPHMLAGSVTPLLIPLVSLLQPPDIARAERVRQPGRQGQTANKKPLLSRRISVRAISIRMIASSGALRQPRRCFWRSGSRDPVLDRAPGQS